MVKAIYPPEAKAKGIEGTAVVKISVDETGSVDKTEVVSGDPILAASCADALKQWRFKPYIKNGKPVRVAASLPCNFAASNDVPPVLSIQDLSDRQKPTNARNMGVARQTAPPDSESLVLIKKVKATYPMEAETGQLQGEVVVKLLVDETGEVAQTTVVSGNSVLASSVVDAVKKWRFEPFVRNGKSIKVSTVITYDFAFKDKIVVDKLNDPAAMGFPRAPTNDMAAVPPPPQSVRVSGGVIQGLLIYQVQPVYPPEAERARVEGVVVLAAVVSKNGRIKNLRVLSGPVLLGDAAIGAVQQWRYRPYIVMGNPVDVDTTITVNFVLGRP